MTDLGILDVPHWSRRGTVIWSFHTHIPKYYVLFVTTWTVTSVTTGESPGREPQHILGITQGPMRDSASSNPNNPALRPRSSASARGRSLQSGTTAYNGCSSPILGMRHGALSHIVLKEGTRTGSRLRTVRPAVSHAPARWLRQLVGQDPPDQDHVPALLAGREGRMSDNRADPVHLLPQGGHWKKSWCSAEGMNRFTGNVDQATRARCLEAVLEHQAAAHEEPWRQIQNLMDRQAEFGIRAGASSMPLRRFLPSRRSRQPVSHQPDGGQFESCRRACSRRALWHHPSYPGLLGDARAPDGEAIGTIDPPPRTAFPRRDSWAGATPDSSSQ